MVHLASAHLHEPALGNVRSGHVRDDLYHGALLRIPAQCIRSSKLADSDQVDQEDLPGADRFGHPALHSSPKLARFPLSDHAKQAASVLVLAGAALLLLWIGGCGGPGHDDLRVDAERQGVWPSA